MNIKQLAKKIWLSISGSSRIVVLDYPVHPLRSYTGSNASPPPQLYSIIAGNIGVYEQLLQNAVLHKKIFGAVKEHKFITDDTAPGWNNGHLPGLDIIMLYTIIARFKPSMYVEIGSGTSTKVAAQARSENALSFKITSIDPDPRKNIDNVVDASFKNAVQDVNPQIFEQLKENDILFVDGTHLLFPGSDVRHFFLEILPHLKPGVLVQIHDVYLPYDYPLFMRERYYNEQYVLAALLLHHPHKFEIISPNYFIYTEEHLHTILNPIWELDALKNVERHGGSFWMQIK